MNATRSMVFLDVSAELLDRGYSVRFQADGASMHPTIRSGELITIGPVAPAGIRRGDIVLYRLRRRVFAHRVVGIERTRGALKFRLRGDSADECDAPVTPDQILGKVLAVDRDGRHVTLAGRSARLRWILHAARSFLSKHRRALAVLRVDHPVDHAVQNRFRHRPDR
jgi:hypothetical protein